MQIANCLLSLGGDHGNQIMKFHVTAAEIATLIAIHGDESVSEIEPQGHVKRSHRDERGRLLAIYGAAKTADQKPIVEGLYPGIAARVFETLAELDLDQSFYKATGRMAPLEADAPTAEPEATAEHTDDAPEFDADADEAGVGEDIDDGHGAKDDVLG